MRKIKYSFYLRIYEYQFNFYNIFNANNDSLPYF